MSVQRCPICHVSWYDGEPVKHVMTCPNKDFVPYPGPSHDCDHEWDFEKDRCITCGAIYQQVFD